MAKNKRVAERRKRKALKRKERKRRRTEERLPALPPDLALMGERFEPWLEEGGGGPACSLALAARFAEASDEVSDTLAVYGEDARGALEVWPDDERTRELRTLLMEVEAEAARDAAKWSALQDRLSALAARGGHHIHLLDEGGLVSGDEHEDAAVDDDIPY